MTKRLENKEGYAFFNGELTNRPVHKLTVEFILDMVPGAFHQPEDLMKWIAQNPYVKSVELQEQAPDPELMELVDMEVAELLKQHNATG